MNTNIQKSILESLLFVKENPSVIWSEYDMQTIISLYLMKVPEFNPNLIHREYPYMKIKSKKRTHKSDIVIFSKDDVENINDHNGYLIVHGEDSDGNRIEGEKRAVYCTHLFEIKVKRERFKQGVLEDFRLLRKGYSQYRKANPELFSICYFYWNTNRKKIHTDIIEGIDELFIKASYDTDTLINFYLLIGPSHIWSSLVTSHENLSKYVNNQKILLMLKI